MPSRPIRYVLRSSTGWLLKDLPRQQSRSVRKGSMLTDAELRDFRQDVEAEWT